MGTNGKQPISVDADTRKEIAVAVEDLPVVGKTMAFLIRRGWWAAVAMLVLFFLVVPFVTPLLSAAYVKALPRDAGDWYAKWVIDAYGAQIKRNIDDSVRRVVTKNNDNLDFVQQFRAVWTDPNESPTRVYRFPLKEGQEFLIEFRPEQPEPVPCKADDVRVGPADDALQSDDLFQVNVNKGADAYSAGVRTVPENRRFGKAFWQTVASRTSSVESSPSDAGTVEVTMRPKTAQTVLPCYRLAGDLRVIVYKSIDPTDPTLRSADGALAGTPQPEMASRPGDAK